MFKPKPTLFSVKIPSPHNYSVYQAHIKWKAWVGPIHYSSDYLHDISSKISGKLYTIMPDEITDLNNTEQMVDLCYVNFILYMKK